MDRIHIELDGGPRALAVVIEALAAAGATVELDPAIQITEGSDELLWVLVAIGDARAIEATIAETCERWPLVSVKLRSEKL